MDERSPPLRRDLELEATAPDRNRRPRWVLYDPVRHRFAAVGARTLHALFGSDREARVRPPALDDALAQQGLLSAAKSGADLADAHRAQHGGWFGRLIHGYVFFRVPLLEPDAQLASLAARLSFAFKRWFWGLVLVTGLVGALLVARQWERFVASANGLLTFEGLIGSALALVFVKAVHELAHGIAARRYGCRVPTMGVAFMLGYPMPYTDVSDAWRLTDRRQRVAIDVAGVAAELVLAVVATLFWVFLPDGLWRDACFFVAAVSWMMSVLVNLNPFMRFDGYYLLADAVNLPNLHARCSTLARNHIRRLLFGTALEADEPLSGSARRWLIAFAWALWLYRVALFVGIALIVYHATFKVLGIALFLVEIAFFIGRPLAREGAVWWRHRAQFLSRHEGRRTRWIAVGLMIAAFLPLPQRLHLPAIAVPHAQADVFPPADGRLLRLTVANGDEVTAGQVIAVVRSDDLLVARRRAEITLARLAAEARRISSDDVDRAQTLVINREIAAARAEVSGLRARIARLTIQAPASGIVDGITAGLARGDHVSKTDRLLGIRSDTAARVIAFADDTERVRLTGEVAVFVPARFDARRLKLTRLGTTMQPVQSLEFDALARSYGGPIDVEPRDVRGRRQLRPTGALFRLPYAVVREDETSHATRYLGPGTVIASGTWRSLAYAVFEQVTFVLISESGL